MAMHKLLARQLEKSRASDGEVDLAKLGDYVSDVYAQQENDRRRTDHAIALMVEELDTLNRGLETLVGERTAALREREVELARRNEMLDAALNNMSQALLMFDATGRIVINNDRYVEMYGLPPDRVKPGVSLKELLAMRAAVGTFSGDPEKYAEVLRTAIGSGQTCSRMVDLPDGRTIHVVSHPMADGSWVVTHDDVTERRRAEMQIAHLAHHDPLTDLPNRMLLRERLGLALANVQRGARLAVLYLDLDNFKSVNDTLGHQIGDELLKAVAQRLRGCVREADTVARVAGDEFVIIQTEFSQLNDTANLARRVCEAIKAPYDLLGHAVVGDSSIGIAVAPDDGTAPDELLNNADMALYRAKADGRGSYRFFEPEMDAHMKARRALELALRNALVNGEFDLHYQPIVDLSCDRVTCCEALIRWRHPERGMVPPLEFIPIAEEIGLINSIGEWVIRRACADAASWPDDIKVAVNLSAIQVMNPGVVQVVIGALAAARLPAERLEIEITESVLMQNTDTTLATLHKLREIGVSISMDDFGTGYSSLSYLRRFPFDKIKIDRCFINGLSDGDDSIAIVRAVAGLAKNLSMRTTAEGVETQQQLDQLRALGCSEMQGFLFSPPCSIKDVLKLMRSGDEVKKNAVA